MLYAIFYKINYYINLYNNYNITNIQNTNNNMLKFNFKEKKSIKIYIENLNLIKNINIEFNDLNNRQDLNIRREPILEIPNLDINYQLIN